MSKKLPGIGTLTVDDNGDLHTPQFTLAPLDLEIHVEISDLEEDNEAKATEAIRNFRALPANALEAATNATFAYYKDFANEFADDEDVQEWLPQIEEPAKVWEHVTFPDFAVAQPGYEDDSPWYVVLECECDWEEKQGLQLVFRNGSEITEAGEYDGLPDWSDDMHDASGDGLYKNYG